MIGDVLQPTHLIFILVVALLVLGPKRLPEVGRSLGKGIRDFRGAVSGITDPEPPPEVPAEPPDVQVTPVTPATTTPPVEETVAPSASSTLADEPVPGPASLGATIGLDSTEQSGSPLLPHVEPEEVQAVAPASDRSRPD